MRKLNASSWALIIVTVLAVSGGVALLVFAPAAMRDFRVERLPFRGRAPVELFEEYADTPIGELTVGDLMEMREEMAEHTIGHAVGHGAPGRFGRAGFGMPRARGGFGPGMHPRPGLPLGGILLLGGGVALVVFLVRRRRNGESGGSGHGDSSLSILEQRFAEGRISEEELARRRAVLRGEE